MNMNYILPFRIGTISTIFFSLKLTNKKINELNLRKTEPKLNSSQPWNEMIRIVSKRTRNPWSNGRKFEFNPFDISNFQSNCKTLRWIPQRRNALIIIFFFSSHITHISGISLSLLWVSVKCVWFYKTQNGSEKKKKLGNFYAFGSKIHLAPLRKWWFIICMWAFQHLIHTFQLELSLILFSLFALTNPSNFRHFKAFSRAQNIESGKIFHYKR